MHYWYRCMYMPLTHPYLGMTLALYPGHMGRGKSGLVSTVCACANDSGNLLWTSPIMDKLHVVVMRRNTQTRYMACSVAAQLCLCGDGFHYQRHKGWHDKDYTTTTASSTITVLVVETNGSLVADGLPNPMGSHRNMSWPKSELIKPLIKDFTFYLPCAGYARDGRASELYGED